MAKQVQTIKDVVALLRLREKTMCAMTQAGEVRAVKTRRQHCITRTEPTKRNDDGR